MTCKPFNRLSRETRNMLYREIVKISPRPSQSLLGRDDLEGYALLGLLEAEARYEPEKGHFSAFARQWVRGALLQGLAHHHPLSRRTRERLQRQLEDSEDLDRREAQHQHLREIAGYLIGQPQLDLEDHLICQERRRQLRWAWGQLSDEDRETLTALYDLDGIGDTGASLGRRRGVSRATISRCHQRALRALRRTIRAYDASCAPSEARA